MRPRCCNCGRGFTWKRNERSPWLSVVGLDYYCGLCQEKDDVAQEIRAHHDRGRMLYLVLGNSSSTLRTVRVDGLWTKRERGLERLGIGVVAK